MRVGGGIRESRITKTGCIWNDDRRAGGYAVNYFPVGSLRPDLQMRAYRHAYLYNLMSLDEYIAAANQFQSLANSRHREDNNSHAVLSPKVTA